MAVQFDIYSRRGCHLCDDLLESLELLCRGREVTIDVHDVDERSDWARDYGGRVPVLVHQGAELCEYFLDEGRVRAVLPPLRP